MSNTPREVGNASFIFEPGQAGLDQSTLFCERITPLLQNFPSIAVDAAPIYSWLTSQPSKGREPIRKGVEEFKANYSSDVGNIEFDTNELGNFFRGQDIRGHGVTLQAMQARSGRQVVRIQVDFSTGTPASMVDQVLHSWPQPPSEISTRLVTSQL